MCGTVLTGCGSEPLTGPTPGIATITITRVLAPAEESTHVYEFGVDVALSITATDDLIPRTDPKNLPFYLCLSEDGMHRRR
jgi:hypothetical protein